MLSRHGFQVHSVVYLDTYYNTTIDPRPVHMPGLRQCRHQQQICYPCIALAVRVCTCALEITPCRVGTCGVHGPLLHSKLKLS